ncbi:uncharacterized protein LOC129912067 [Episyrphus balteatus]|uniref:uncharacterized protein LOC129912067 n=1 Tax=Episyrphus balteatus TaxID=286459 RepID=UPI0024861F19|nr:uncharacterized protein LOC129912067 [Episyrphus balteatus]
MLSNLISSQKFVLIVDSNGQEKIALPTINGFLKEQGQSDSIKLFNPKRDANCEENNYQTFLEDCCDSENKLNVILPPLSDLLLYNPKKSELFQFIHQLKLNRNIKQIYVWASKVHAFETFTIACLEYMADHILYIETKDTLSILTRKPGGAVTNKNYTFTRTKDSFQVEAIKKAINKVEQVAVKPEQLGTFKIELEEDELIARNALKMPYEKTSETEGSGGGNIIYTPDKDDDFDEEDPDDDLYI